MKKLLTIILSAALILSTTACGFNSELEALKKENEKLKAQIKDICPILIKGSIEEARKAKEA